MKSLRFCALTILVLAGSLCAFGQSLPPQTADDQMGFQPFQSYHGGDIDHIGLANGTLNLDFPFLSYPQRGKLHLDFHLYYNNNPQHIAEFCPPPANGQQPPCFYLWGYTPAPPILPVERGDVFVGWTEQMAITGTGSSVVSNPGKNSQYTTYYERWSVQTADGATHALGNLGTQTMAEGCPGCQDPDYYTIGNGPWETLDATGYRVNGSLATAWGAPNGWLAASAVVDSDGVVAGTQDPNGNVITANGTGGPWITGFTDTLGRAVTAPPTASSASNTGTSACPSGALPVDHAVLWSVPGTNGGTSNFTFCYVKVGINVPQTSSPTIKGEPGPSMHLQSIVLPDGHSWNFQYNDPGDGSTYNGAPINYGTLTQIALPTGGTISYTYTTTGSLSAACQNQGRFVTSRTVNANDGTGSHTWTYQYSSNGSGAPTTTINDPLGNYSVHTFSGLNGGGCALYATQVQSFQSGGTLLKTVNTTYSSAPGGPATNVNGPFNVVPTQITTTWANGKTATVNKSYDSGYSFIDYQGSSTNPYNNSPYNGLYGKEISESATDYGNNAAGPTLKITNSGYRAFSNSNYLAANMLDLVSSLQITDGNGNQLAKTTYGYDESSLQSSGVTTQLGSPPNSVRGNPTSVNHWLNTTGGNVTTTSKWYDSGELYQAIDALGNPTTHSYDLAYAGAYSTKTTNALSQTVSGTYDFNTGLLTSFTDANGSYQASGNTPGDPAHTTTLQYNDPMWRLTQVQSPADPGGNHPLTTINYPDANTVERLKKITASLTDDSYGYFDGVGRHYKSVHASANNATVVTSYDADGRTASVTNPYFSTSDPTYGVTQTQYDGIGRVTKTTKQDNSVVTAQYDQTSSTSANATCAITTDEAGNQRQVCNDGMGRLIEVDEPGNAFAGTNASGSVNVNGTLQSAQVPNPNGPFTPGTGSFSVTSDGNGPDGDRQTKVTTCQRIGNNNVCTTVTYYDTGYITVTIDGFTTQQVAYGANTTTSTLATNLASALNASGSPVTASSSGSTVNMTSIATGPNSNYPWSSSSVTNNSHFPSGTTSFPISPTSGALTGGSQATMTIYDWGTVTATIGSYSVTVCYGSSNNPSCNGQVNNTASQVASALAAALNGSGSPVSASASGSTISITYGTPGTAGNVSVNITSTSGDPTHFPQGSFSGSGSLSGGANPYPSGLAHPYLTLYSYDALGNLLSVNQKGDGSQAARQRSFTYDSLSRLLTATNPESGQITYSYDANGNVLQKTSPAPNQTGSATQTISYCYDAINRVTGKAYSAQTCQSGPNGPESVLPAGTAVVSYTYDGGTNGIGHLTSLTDQAGSGSYGYDALGRIASEQRTIAGIQKTLSYTYNLDSSVATLTYPSGAVVTYTPDAAGRDLSAVDAGNNINYITQATYGPDSSLTGFVSGNSSTFSGISNSAQYNTRLQVCRITALTTGTLPKSCTDSADTGNLLDLGYNLNLGNDDNGNVIGITNYKDSTRSQSFTYDTLNRLTSAQNTGTNCSQMTANGKTEYWGNNYVYDPWGNLLQKTVTKCSAENLSVSVLSNNQLSGYSYDAAGNMTHDSSTNVSYSFDAENRITGAAGYTYTYDADGNRVEKSNGSTGTIYWYMTPGIVAESDLSGNLRSEYTFFGGARVARKDFPGGAVSYYLSDHLKTASVITNSAGTITEDEDYYPWGGELQFVNSDSNHYKFTAKERDSETGLDYFGARYYGNWYGRFLSADWSAKPEAVPYSDLHDPQSLNLYSYVRNVPTSRADADGHLWGEEHKPHGHKTAPEPDTSTGVEGLCGFWCWLGSWFSNHVNTDGSPQYSGKNPIFSSDQLLENSAQQAGGALNAVATGIQFVDITGITAANRMAVEGNYIGALFTMIAALAPGGEEASAGVRALELSTTLGKSGGFVTVAVTRTEEGITIISTSEKYVRNVIRRAIAPGEVVATGQATAHAEINGVAYAQRMGLHPTGVAASRAICGRCAAYLENHDIPALSPLKPGVN